MIQCNPTLNLPCLVITVYEASEGQSSGLQSTQLCKILDLMLWTERLLSALAVLAAHTFRVPAARYQDAL